MSFYFNDIFFLNTIKGDSFYQFTCGNFLKRQLNDDESSISSFKTALTNLNEALSG